MMTDIPEDLKLTDAQVIDILWKLTVAVKGLRETQEFIITQMLQQGIVLQKRQTGEGYFKRSLQDNFKQMYESLELLTLKVKGLSGEAKRGRYSEYL